MGSQRIPAHNTTMKYPTLIVSDNEGLIIHCRNYLMLLTQPYSGPGASQSHLRLLMCSEVGRVSSASVWAVVGLALHGPSWRVWSRLLNVIGDGLGLTWCRISAVPVWRVVATVVWVVSAVWIIVFIVEVGRVPPVVPVSVVWPVIIS